MVLGLLLLGGFVLADVAVWAQQGLGTPVTPPLTGSPTLTPIPPNTAPGATTAQPYTTFDPYSTQPNAALSAPSLLSPSTVAPNTIPGAAQPYTPGAAQPYTPGAAQPYTPGAPPPATYGQPPQYPGNAQPYYGYQQPAPGYGAQSPPVLFPQGMTAPAAPTAYGNPLKLFQNVSLNWAWLAGDSGDDLDINDGYVTTTFAFPNFLWSGQPWYMSPGFGLHLWSGPYPIEGSGVLPPGLPSKAYSAFLDLGWQTDKKQSFGVELSGRLGIYSDFGRIDSESFRPQGVALMRLNLSPTWVLKAGVEYINRADIKMFPAVGLLWTPNPQTRFDIYFPQPKLATYLTTVGSNEMWWYIAGEYGGGSWTANVDLDTAIGIPPAYDENVYTLMDINDWRVMLGIEFYAPGSGGVGNRKMFLEAGYVWEREVILVARPEYSFNLSETFMLRGGFAF